MWLTNRATTSGWVYTWDSFAILSLRFLLISATGADFLVEKTGLTLRKTAGSAGDVTRLMLSSLGGTKDPRTVPGDRDAEFEPQTAWAPHEDTGRAHSNDVV